MKEEELPTMSEVFDAFRRGEMKEGQYACCRLNEQSKSRIWLPYREVKMSVELQDEFNKERDKLLWNSK